MEPTEQDRILEDTRVLRQQMFEEQEPTELDRLVNECKRQFALQHPGTQEFDFMSFEDLQKMGEGLHPPVTGLTAEDYVEVYLSAHPYAMNKIADNDIGKISRVFDRIPTSFFFQDNADAQRALGQMVEVAAQVLPERKVAKALRSRQEPDIQAALENIQAIQVLHADEENPRKNKPYITSPAIEGLVLKHSYLLSQVLFDGRGDFKPRFLKFLQKQKGVEKTEEIAHQFDAACVMAATTAVSSGLDPQTNVVEGRMTATFLFPLFNKLATERDTHIRTLSQQIWNEEKNRVLNVFTELGIEPRPGATATNDALASLLLHPSQNAKTLGDYIRTNFQNEAAVRALLELERLNIKPKPGVRATSGQLVRMLLQNPPIDAKKRNAYLQANFENAAAIIPKNLDGLLIRAFKPRSYNRIDTGKKDEIKFLSAEHTLERMEKMVDEAIEAAKLQSPDKRPLKIHLHILSVLDASNPKDKAKIDNVDNIKNFVLATYKSKHPNVELQITHETASMPDHQMRDSHGNLLQVSTMDDYLKRHRGEPEPGVQQAYNIHCKAGQGRSATVMMCEDIRYNGLLPSESSAQIKGSRSKAHGVNSKGTRPDQRCFVYSYFFHAAAEALGPGDTGRSSVSSKLRERFDRMGGADVAKEQKETEIAALVSEVKEALSIDYSYNINSPGNAKPAQWAIKLTESFLKFREQFKKARGGVDLLDQVLIDYAKDPGKYSKVQKQNLSAVLATAEYPSLAMLGSPAALAASMERAESPPKKPPMEVQVVMAQAVIRDAYKPLSFWERNFSSNKRSPMSMGRDQLQRLCNFPGVLEGLPPHIAAIAAQVLKSDATNLGQVARDAALSRAREATTQTSPVLPPLSRVPPVPPPSRVPPAPPPSRGVAPS